MGHAYWKQHMQLLVVILSVIFLKGEVVAMSDEKRLIKYLLENYARVGLNGRPVFNSTEVVDVSVKLSLIRVNDVDTEAQTMDSLGWLTMEWTDHMVRWDPADFGAVNRLAVPAQGIWTPDVVLINAVAPTEQLHEAQVMCSPDGHVRYTQNVHLRSLCPIPEDQSDNPECPLTFGSWVHDTDSLLVTCAKRADVDFYNYNPNFMLISTTSSMQERTYKCCPDQRFSDVTFTISLERLENKDNDAGVEETNAAIRTGGIITALIAALALLAASQ